MQTINLAHLRDRIESEIELAISAGIHIPYNVAAFILKATSRKSKYIVDNFEGESILSNFSRFVRFCRNTTPAFSKFLFPFPENGCGSPHNFHILAVIQHEPQKLENYLNKVWKRARGILRSYNVPLKRTAMRRIFCPWANGYSELTWNLGKTAIRLAAASILIEYQVNYTSNLSYRNARLILQRASGLLALNSTSMKVRSEFVRKRLIQGLAADVINGKYPIGIAVLRSLNYKPIPGHQEVISGYCEEHFGVLVWRIFGIDSDNWIATYKGQSYRSNGDRSGTTCSKQFARKALSYFAYNKLCA